METAIPDIVKTSPALYGTRISLPHSREHDTGLCPKPDTVRIIVFHLFKICFEINSNMVAPRRSQWQRGLRHELSLLARTRGSWVRIPLNA
jgi:hypothetical protein